jgi:next-to-BRCA1 protein 1
MYPLIGVRYKCNECDDFDFCSDCHQQKKEKGSHIRSHKMETILNSDSMLNDDKNKNETVHSNTRCDGCGMDPLIGVRYKCNECYNFDFCSACHQQKKEKGSHIRSHKMAAILEPDDSLALSNLNEDNKEKLLNEMFSLIINMIRQDDQSGRRHFGVKCNLCERKNFNLDRYRCLICKDYDICGKCFEDKRVNLNHMKGHPLIRFSDPNQIFGKTLNKNMKIDYEVMQEMFKNYEHTDITCNGCSNLIIGIRFKCDE